MPQLKAKPGTPLHMDEIDTRTFEQWMQAIDSLISRYFGLSIYDLPDCTFKDWYEDRLRPIHAANLALAQVNDLEEE